MELKDYGWDAETAAHFETCAGPGLIPGRVVRQSRDRATLVTPLGELAGEVSGRFRHEAAGPADYPVVGDWAVVEPFGEGPALIPPAAPERVCAQGRR
jgi:ribosome biogenesis GTPase